MIVLNEAGKNVSSTDVVFSSSDVVVVVDGAMDGESVFIERKRDDGAYSPLADGEITTTNEKLVRLWRGATIRLRTSNGTGTPSITAHVMQRDR
jgi:archaellum component FlaG (FlaF/FlaG flagellin family)